MFRLIVMDFPVEGTEVRYPIKGICYQHDLSLMTLTLTLRLRWSGQVPLLQSHFFLHLSILYSLRASQEAQLTLVEAPCPVLKTQDLFR